jgi:carbon storage regulator
MLVLSRKSGEQIFLGSDVTVTVVAVIGNRVKIGIEAPRGVPIWRGELTPPVTPNEPVPAGEGEPSRLP